MKKTYRKKRSPRRTMRWPKAKAAYRKRRTYAKRKPLVARMRYKKYKFTNTIPVLVDGNANTYVIFNRFKKTVRDDQGEIISIGPNYGLQNMEEANVNPRWTDAMKDHQQYKVDGLSITYFPLVTGSYPSETTRAGA